MNMDLHRKKITAMTSINTAHSEISIIWKFMAYIMAATPVI